MIRKCLWRRKLRLRYRGEKDDPPCSLIPARNTTEDRQDDAEADCQPRQGVGEVSGTVRRPLSEQRRFRLVANLCPGIALKSATQKHRGHGPGTGHSATHSTAFRRIDQVG